ncbi:MAG TPA: Clp protease N-terminal domain-containing protein [Actinomycetota bacterium]|nr:Clp protease N-terminal domain-containing protein [Actinomycetota bacterium]
MDVNSFTHRAAEALATAQREARSNDHQRIEPEHLLVALLADPDGVVYPVVRRADRRTLSSSWRWRRAWARSSASSAATVAWRRSTSWVRAMTRLTPSRFMPSPVSRLISSSRSMSRSE